MPELSVLVPARNEGFLLNTILDVLAHARADTEVIVVLDGLWPVEPIPVHPKVHVLYHPAPVGQRAATNEAARISHAPYIMKLDAHCSVADGFDVELLKAAQTLAPETIQIPAQYNLHAFNWRCDTCGNETYQGPTPTACKQEPCPGTTFQRVLFWERRVRRWSTSTKPGRGGFVLSTSWCFDHELHFQYDRTPRPKAEFQETMSCLGACWFLSKDYYWRLGGLDEGHGSWGQMGTELACKTWLSGGRMVTNTHTWFAHLFRTQGGDFGFPYELTGGEVAQARRHSHNLWLPNAWPQQTQPLSWLIDKFAPIRGWHQPAGADMLARVQAAGTAFTPSV